MHAVLDVMEALATENAQEKDLDKVYMSLYRPEAGQKFDPDESDASFDAFFEATRDLT